MSRDIKFRAWDNLDDEMVSWKDFHDRWTKQPLKSLSSQFPYEHLEYMQYTGLKDKNGKEIYEGDIVKWSTEWSEENISVVKWGNDIDSTASNYPAFDLDPCASDELNSFAYLDFEGELEVIGNIYENPELLK